MLKTDKTVITILLAISFIILVLCIAIFIVSFNATYYIRAEYNGIIPPAVRARIDKAKPDFDSIHILTEIPLWEIKKVVHPNRCPLVLGRKGKRLFIIDRFYTTYVEEYIRKEFTF